jgi:HAMP domain-containing protein
LGNTASGDRALSNNTTGGVNTATGEFALGNNTTGGSNTASGYFALGNNTTGEANAANGVFALLNNTSGSNNTALGYNAGSGVTTASNVICIGTPGFNVPNTCFIGNIYGQMAGFGTPVYINSGGQLGTSSSSQRFKDNIKPIDKASEVLFALKPVTFRYKKEFDPKGIPQFGLVAEDVEKIDPDLVVRDADGKVNTVRYDQVNAMLLNEFLKQHRKVEEQQAAIAQLKSTVAQQRKDSEATAAQQQKEIEALTTTVKQQTLQIQKVSAQLAAASPSSGGLEATKPAPQVVENNR